MPFSTMNEISWKFTGKPYDLNSLLTPEQVWAKLDLPPEEVRTALNGLITALNSVADGSSGADNSGMTPIPAISASLNTTQSIVEAFVTRLQSIVDGASGADFTGATAIAGLTGSTVQSLLESLKSYIDTKDTAQTTALTTHKGSADHDSRYYTETEINTKVDMTNGAIASVDGVSNAKGNIDLVGGTGITITPDNVGKKITITATGEALPAAHASSHASGGSDPVSPASIGAIPTTEKGAAGGVALHDTVASHLADYAAHRITGTEGGTGVHLTLTTTAGNIVVADGDNVQFKLPADIQDGADLAVDGGTAYAIKTSTGEVVSAGAKAGSYISLVFNGTSFILQGESGVKINNTSKQTFTVDTGQTITKGDLIKIVSGKVRSSEIDTALFGSLLNFKSNQISFPGVVQLSENTYLVIYNDTSTNNGCAVVLTVDSSMNVSKGAEFVFSSSSPITFLSLDKITSSTALVCYGVYSGGTDYGKSAVLSVSGTTISAGTAVTFNTGAIYSMSTTVVDSTHGLVVFQDGGNSNYGTAVVLGISGTTLTANSKYVFNSTATSDITTFLLDTNKVIVGFSITSAGKAAVLSISGTTVSTGTLATYNTAATSSISILALSTTSAIVSYSDTGNSGYLTSCVLTVSGTTITAGSETVISSSSAVANSSQKIDSGKMMLIYAESTTYYGKVAFLTISGTTITSMQSVMFDNSAVASCFSALINNKALIVFRKVSSSNYGEAIALKLTKTTHGYALANATDGNSLNCVMW